MTRVGQLAGFNVIARLECDSCARNGMVNVLNNCIQPGVEFPEQPLDCRVGSGWECRAMVCFINASWIWKALMS